MKNKNQTGFTALGVVLVVVLIAAVAGVGYYVGNQSTEEAPQTSETEADDQTEQNSEGDTNQREASFTGTEINCNDEFTYLLPNDWHSGTIENGGNCYVASQNELPPQGQLYGDDISFVYNTEQVNLSLEDWVEEYFNNRAGGDYPLTKTNQQTIQMNNGDDAILVEAEGGHYVGENNSSTYFFYKKDSLGISTSWYDSNTDEELLELAQEVVQTIR